MGRSHCSCGCAVRGSRLRAYEPSPKAKYYAWNLDPEPLAAPKQPSRKPLVRTRRSPPSPRASPPLPCDYTLQRAQSKRRRPPPLKGSLADGRHLPSVQPTPTVLFRNVISRSDHLDHPHGAFRLKLSRIGVGDRRLPVHSTVSIGHVRNRGPIAVRQRAASLLPWSRHTRARPLHMHVNIENPVFHTSARRFLS